MASLLELLEVEEAIVKKKADKKVEAQETLDRIELELEQRYGQILADAARFPDLPPGLKEPPEKWISELGEERAWNVFRLSSYALESSKEAPVGLTLAQKVYSGLMQARLKRGGGAPKQMPITINFVMQAPEPLPRIEAIDTTGRLLK